MEVSAWRNAYTFGIRVGARNRAAYFDPVWQEIEIELHGDLRRFALTPSFWHLCPEFRDSGTPVIREWLRRHYGLPWQKGRPPRMRLDHISGNRFRLIPHTGG